MDDLQVGDVVAAEEIKRHRGEMVAHGALKKRSSATGRWQSRSSERLREFRESTLESLTFQLFSTASLYDNYEKVKLADALTFLCG